MPRQLCSNCINLIDAAREVLRMGARPHWSTCGCHTKGGDHHLNCPFEQLREAVARSEMMQ